MAKSVKLKGEFDNELQMNATRVNQLLHRLLVETDNPKNWTKDQLLLLNIIQDAMMHLGQAVEILSDKVRDD
jgi:hypothetical protein